MKFNIRFINKKLNPLTLTQRYGQRCSPHAPSRGRGASGNLNSHVVAKKPNKKLVSLQYEEELYYTAKYEAYLLISNYPTKISHTENSLQHPKS